MDGILGPARARHREVGARGRGEGPLASGGGEALMAFLQIDGLTKEFEGTAAVDRLSLSVAHGKILALLGPSGSGKTTTLRMLGGFEAPDAGRIVVDGEEVTALSPQRRR